MTQEGMASATEAKYSKLQMWRGAWARFPRAAQEIARISADGCTKHEVPPGDMGYLNIPDAEGVYSDAFARHMVEIAEEQDATIINDDDGGHLHLAHAVWNLMAWLEVVMLSLEEEAEDDPDEPDEQGDPGDENDYFETVRIPSPPVAQAAGGMTRMDVLG